MQNFAKSRLKRCLFAMVFTISFSVIHAVIQFVSLICINDVINVMKNVIIVIHEPLTS